MEDTVTRCHEGWSGAWDVLTGWKNGRYGIVYHNRCRAVQGREGSTEPVEPFCLGDWHLPLLLPTAAATRSLAQAGAAPGTAARRFTAWALHP